MSKGEVGLWMIVMIVCYAMWRHYRMKMRCHYCGAEWGKHMAECPYGGSGSRMES